MIYLETSGGHKIIILEPGNLERLRGGEPIQTPDRTVMIGFTPDIVWVSDQLRANKGHLSGAVIGALLEEASKRPEATPGYETPFEQLIKEGKPTP